MDTLYSLERQKNQSFTKKIITESKVIEMPYLIFITKDNSFPSWKLQKNSKVSATLIPHCKRPLQ